MGLSSSKSKTTTDAKTTETGTTTPTNLPGLDQSLMDYTSRLNAFGDQDPNQFVAPASPLQNQAWGNADKLADWQPQARLAAQQALQAGQRPANLAGSAQTYQAATGTASGYGAPQLGQASIVAARGYDAPTLGNAGGYAAPRIGAPIGAQGQSYSTQPVGAAQIDPTRDQQAYGAQSQSLLTGLQDYQNPFQRDVIDTSLSDYDLNAGQQRAAQAAQAAKAGAFGGSRFGIAEGQLLGEQGRGRAALDAGLRSQGFDRATALSGQDADRRQNTSLFNAQNETAVSGNNAAAANARALAQAGLGQEATLFNATKAADAARFGAESGERASLFNSGQDQARLLAQAGMDEGAARFGAEGDRAFALERAGIGERAGQFNANLGQQTDFANQQADQQMRLAQAGLSADALRFTAGNQQQMELARMAGQDQAAAAGAAAGNQFSLFNAGQGDIAANRELQSAQTLGGLANDYGAGVRSDLGLMNQFGGDQRAVEQQYAMAGPAQLEELAQLYGTTPYNLFSGQNVNTAGTQVGTNTTVEKPSLFSMLQQGAASAARAYGAGKQ